MAESTLGYDNAMIGEQMNLAISTVKFHFTSIYKKLGVTGGKVIRRVRLLVLLSEMSELQEWKRQ